MKVPSIKVDVILIGFAAITIYNCTVLVLFEGYKYNNIIGSKIKQIRQFPVLFRICTFSAHIKGMKSRFICSTLNRPTNINITISNT